MPLLDSPSSPTKATQPLPGAADAPTTTFWSRLRTANRWPLSTQLGLAATGGALAVAIASLAVGVLVGNAPAPRRFFGPAETASQSNNALHIVDHRAPSIAVTPLDADQNADAGGAVEDASTTDAPPYQATSTNPDERLNRDGTGLASLEPQSDEDRRRLEQRHQEDRILRETRALEDKKRQIEREIEAKQLEQKRQQETQQMMEAREAEDKKRLDDRLAEDRRLLDERHQTEKQDIEAQQNALNDESKKLAEATPQQ